MNVTTMNNIDHSLLQGGTSSHTLAVRNDKMAYKNYWSFKPNGIMVRWYGGSFASSWTLLLASGNYYLVRHQKITNMSNVSFGHTWLLTCTHLLLGFTNQWDLSMVLCSLIHTRFQHANDTLCGVLESMHSSPYFWNNF
jgi:hypothetical protein